MANAILAYELHARLLHVEPAVIRHFVVPSTMSLAKFHVALQIIMGWDNYHLHCFVNDRGRFGPIDPEFDDGMIDERRRSVKTLLKTPEDTVLYEYDFGDGWEHEIVLKSIFEVDPSQPLPVCLDGDGACPPEDVGGPPGYSDFLEALADKSDPRHDEFMDWIGGEFDSEYFDIHSTNVLLGQQLAR